MRAFCSVALLVVFLTVFSNAQMRGSSGGFRGGAVARSSRPAMSPGVAARSQTRPTVGSTLILGTNPPSPRVASPFVFSGFRGNGINSFLNPFILPSDVDNRFIGRRGFRNSFGFGGFGGFAGGWGWGWPVDYSNWNYDEMQAQYQTQIAQDERVREEMLGDQKRQMEYQQQLLDQRAADAAALKSNPAPSTQQISTSAERAVPPTVLVYKDHHQTELSSYAIAGNTIYEIAPHWTRKIQLSELDIPATIAANRERGIQFKLPSSSTAVLQ